MVKMNPAINWKCAHEKGERNVVADDSSQLTMSSLPFVRVDNSADFNRVCGSPVSATARPADRLFTADIGVSPRLFSISATFGDHISHVAGPRDAGRSDTFMLFRRAGGALLRIDGTVLPLDVAIVGSDTDFTIRAAERGRACSVGWIALTDAPDLAARMVWPIVAPCASADGSVKGCGETLRALGESILSGMAAGGLRSAADVALLAGRLTGRIHDLLENEARIERPDIGGSCPQAGGRDIVAAVQRYLRQHAHKADVTPAHLARHCAVSVRKLYNAFARVDLSLHAVVLSYRLEEARRQLAGGETKKVTAIAFDAGFRDVSTFYRNFRREFGYSPRGAAGGASDGGDVALVGESLVAGQRDPTQVRDTSFRGMPPPAGKGGGRREGDGEAVPLPRETLFRHRSHLRPGLPSLPPGRHRFSP
jgi:AraC-like DNA-binding protein